MEDNPDWVGDATTSNFTINKSQLEKASERRAEWLDEVDRELLDKEGLAIGLEPEAEDARRNSGISGDHNVLHQYPEVVGATAEEYGFVREPVQDGDVVVNQGMSLMDSLVSEVDDPVRSLGGRWSKMVYAPENDQPRDRVVIEEEASGEFDVGLLPAGSDEELDAGRLNFSYAESDGYHEDHNEYMLSVADQAVGRSFNTPDDIRNGELLISNNLAAEGPIDWDRVESLDFRMADVEEQDFQVTAEWDIDVNYGESTDAGALTYSETSMYADGFEDIDEVRNAYSGNDLVEAYGDVMSATARATAEATMLPWKISTATMRSMSD